MIDQVLSDIRTEIQRQKTHHGDNSIGGTDLNVGQRYLVLGEEVGEVGTAVMELDPSALLEELIQVAACATAWATYLLEDTDWKIT